MRIRFRVIASGSNGNAAYLSTPEGTLLIDAGISRKRIFTALAEDNIPFDDVIGILVTHAHTDHCLGLPVLCDHLKNVPIYGTPGTIKTLRSYGNRDWRFPKISENSYILSFNNPFIPEIENFSFLALPTTHDAEDSAALQISYNDVRTTFLTDTGKIDSEHIEILKESSIVLVEMNHKIQALQDSKRPEWLKQRIRRVHLANSDTIGILDSLVDSEIKGFFIGHISQECNSPALVATSLVEWESDQSIPWTWYLCRRDKSGKAVEYSNGQLKTSMEPLLPL